MVPVAEGQTRTHSVVFDVGALVVGRPVIGACCPTNACFVGALVGRFDGGCFVGALVGRFDVGCFDVGALVVG